MKKPDAAWLLAYARYREAEGTLESAIATALPIGRMVRYWHGEHERMGEVTMVSDKRVRLLSVGKRVVWIEAWRIMDALQSRNGHG